MQPHPLSLAAGVLPEFSALEVAQAACASGFRNVGFTVKPWADQTTQDIARCLAEDGVGDGCEVVRIDVDGTVSEDDQRIVDVGGALGAANVLIISNCPDEARTAEALVQLAERAAPFGMRACLEFMRFTKVPTLASARRVLAMADHPAAGLLVDTLHIARTGETDEISTIEPESLPYVQFCDGLAACGDDDASLIKDALDDRSPPGGGVLPLAKMLGDMADGMPLSLEVRSKALRERFPEARARAGHLLERTQKFLSDLGRSDV